MTGARLRIALDLEATCWIPEEDPALAADQRNECEVIEIGAVRIDDPGPPFRAVVRPRRHPRLSAFCTRLTGLTQAEVDAAAPFPEALAALRDWAGGDEGLLVASWGAWDDRQLRKDAGRWGLPTPRWTSWNVKRAVAKRAAREGARRGGWMGLSAALTHAGLPFEGTPHRALDDARALAALIRWLEAG